MATEFRISLATPDLIVRASRITDSQGLPHGSDGDLGQLAAQYNTTREGLSVFRAGIPQELRIFDADDDGDLDAVIITDSPDKAIFIENLGDPDKLTGTAERQALSSRRADMMIKRHKGSVQGLMGMAERILLSSFDGPSAGLDAEEAALRKETAREVFLRIAVDPLIDPADRRQAAHRLARISRPDPKAYDRCVPWSVLLMGSVGQRLALMSACDTLSQHDRNKEEWLAFYSLAVDPQFQAAFPQESFDVATALIRNGNLEQGAAILQALPPLWWTDKL